MRDLILQFRADTAPLKKSGEQVKKSVRGMAAEAEKSGQSFGSRLFGKVGDTAKKVMGAAWTATKTAAKAGGAAVAAVGVAAIGKGFKRLTAIEDATASLKGLGYSAKDAAAIINGPVLKAVQGTAFGLDEAAAAAQGALGAGVKNGKELQKYLTLVGDAATQSGTDFQSMALMMNKVQGSGKLTGDVLQQMAENGLQVMPMLTKALGKPQAEVQKMVSQGKISAKQFQTILQKNIGGAAQKAGDTTTGAFKNMGAALGRVGAKFLTSVFPMFKQVFSGVTKFLDKIGPSVEKMGNRVGAAIRGLGALLGKGDFTKNLKDAFGWEEDSPIVGALLHVRQAFVKTQKAAGVFVKGFKGQFVSGDTGISNKWVSAIWDAGKKVREVFDGIKQGLGNIDLGNVLAVFSPLGTVLKAALPALAKTGGALKDIGAALGTALVKVLPIAIKLLVTLASTFAGAISQVLPVVAQLLGRLAQSVFPALASILAVVMPLVGKLAETVLPLVVTMFKALEPVLNVVVGALAKFAEIIGKNAGILPVIAAGIIGVTAALNGASIVLKAQVAFYKAWIVITKAAAVAQKAFALGQAIVNAVMAANPIYLVIAAIIALVAVFIIAYKKSETFRKIVDAAFKGIKAGAKAFAKFITQTIPAAFKKVVDWIKSNWKKAVFLNPVTAAIALLIKHRDKIKAIFSALVSWMKGAFKKGWAAIRTVFVAPVQGALNAIRGLFGKIRSAFNSVKSWVSGTWKRGWSKVSGWMSDSVKNGRDKTSTALSGVKERFGKVKTWLGTTWRSGWSKAKDWISNPIANAKDAIARMVGNKGLQRIMRGAVSAIGRIWSGLKSAIGKPLNKVIDFINKGFIRGGINKILNALGVPKGEQIPWLTPVKFAGGGPVTGGRPWQRRGRDRYPAMLDHNEHVLTRDEVHKLGGHRNVFAWRKAIRQGRAFDAPPGLAGGGVVRPVPGGFGSFPSYAGHTGVDFPVGTGTPVHAVMAGLIKSVRALTYSYGKHIIQSLPISGNYEALYAHLNSFKVRAGQRVGAGDVIGYSDSTGNSTGPHLHFTLQHPGGNYVDPTGFLTSGKAPGGDTGGGIGGAITDMIGFLKGLSPVKWLTNLAGGMKSKIIGFLGDHPWARGLARVPGLIMEKAKDTISTKLFGGLGVDDPGGSGVERWRGTIKSALRMNNLPTSDDYVNAWLRQVKSESGGNPKAVQNGYTDVNTISGDLAKGLLQTISATFNAYKFPGHGDIFNGFDNALAAINYAKHAYGSNMLGVIGHGHGYDSGGYLPPGLSLAMNRTGKPEPVLTGQQWNAIGADPQPHTLEVHFHGVIDSSSAAREIERLLQGRNRTTGGITMPSRSRQLVRKS